MPVCKKTSNRSKNASHRSKKESLNHSLLDFFVSETSIDSHRNEVKDISGNAALKTAIDAPKRCKKNNNNNNNVLKLNNNNIHKHTNNSNNNNNNLNNSIPNINDLINNDLINNDLINNDLINNDLINTDLIKNDLIKIDTQNIRNHKNNLLNVNLTVSLNLNILNDTTNIKTSNTTSVTNINKTTTTPPPKLSTSNVRGVKVKVVKKKKKKTLDIRKKLSRSKYSQGDDDDTTPKLNCSPTKSTDIPSTTAQHLLPTTTATTTTSQTRMVDFFPARRSKRTCTSKQIKQREEDEIEGLIVNATREVNGHDLKVVCIEGKGRGVVAGRRFSRGDFVVEYVGDFISKDEARDREDNYSADVRHGCYMYYFKHADKQYCIDATAESDRLGRLLNHSRQHPNCQTKVFEVKGLPRLCLVACREIAEGTELLYDYGDRSKEALLHHPWLSL